jgi:hypothetical protein
MAWTATHEHLITSGVVTFRGISKMRPKSLTIFKGM